MNDLKFAFRQLAKNPGFPAVAVLTLALGIGANTAIFSVVDAVLVKPLPYHDPDRLMVIWTDNPAYNLGIHELPPSQQDILDWRGGAKSFQQLAAIASETIDLKRNGELSRVGAVSATANLFSTLGVQPMLGRTFTAEEEQPGKDKVVILSYAIWQKEFGGDSKLLGTTVTLNNQSRVVVGIMPPGFGFPHSAEMPSLYHLPQHTELWLPASGDAAFWQNDVDRHFIVLGRLNPGTKVSQAQAEMTTIAQRVAKERPATHTGWSTYLRPLAMQVAGQSRPMLFILLGAVGFVLLIACANVANLLLCRSASRRREMAIRAAIGAGRGQIMRQLLIESLLLAACGGLVGLWLGMGALKALLLVSPPNIPRLHEAGFDLSVFVFSISMSLATGLAFGLAPAWNASKVNLSEVLNDSSRSNSGGRGRSFGLIVATETAAAVILLVGACLMLQSFQKLLSLDPGFQKAGVCALDITFRGEQYNQGEARTLFFDQIRERLRNVAGIQSVGAISHLPLSGNENVGYFVVEGAPATQPGHEPLAETRLVTVGSFEALGFHTFQGREFEQADRAGKIPVAIVNETLAHQFFPETEVLGKRIKLKDANDWLTIVGVVRDVRGAELQFKPRPTIYRDQAQDPRYWDEMTLVVRCSTEGMARSLEGALRREIRAIDPELPAAHFCTMDALVSNALIRPRFSSFLLIAFALTATVLAAVGLYSVVAYSVSQRTRELGIRLALGAQRLTLLRLVIVQGVRPALVGLVLGIAGALSLTRFLRSQLYEIKPTDPATLIAVSAVLGLVAVLACWLPARRATKVDPLVALRYE